MTRRPTILLILVAIAMIAAADVANAKSCPEGNSASWWRKVAHQHARSLESPYDQIRAETAQQIRFLSEECNAGVWMSAAVPRLVDIYAGDSSEKMRILALEALQAIGDAEAMSQIRGLVAEEQSENVRRLTRSALDQFDGSRGISN